MTVKKPLKGSACISRDGSDTISGSNGWMGRFYPYITAKFQDQKGRANYSQKINGPTGWKYAVVTLHNHSISFDLNDSIALESFDVGCEIIAYDATSVTVNVYTEVHSNIDDPNPKLWSATVVAVVDWYG